VHTAYLFSVLLHVVAAMAWVGGMIFLVVVIVPLLRRPAMREQSRALFHLLGTRFRTVGWIALGTLVVTGTFNVAYRGYGLEHLASGELFRGRWGHALLMKLSLVAVILVLSGVHDFWIGPGATRDDATPERREVLRRTASIMGRVTFALALAVVALAITLVR
jgi:copper resistance protein D